MLARILSMLFVLVGVSGSPVMAQDLVFSMVETNNCLDAGGPSQASNICVGRSADRCMELTNGGDTTIGMGVCLEAERSQWDDRLNVAYQDLVTMVESFDEEMQKVDANAPSQADALRDMQRAWIVFRDATCDYERAQWGSGSGAGPATLYCLMQATAMQTLYLERQLQAP